jgi:hypothetical protein
MYGQYPKISAIWIPIGEEAAIADSLAVDAG